MTARRRRIALAAVIVVASIAAGTWLRRTPVDWIAVKRTDLVVEVAVTGVLQAVDSAMVAPPQVRDQWNFVITMLAPEGTEVRSGAPVLAFDTSELQRRLETARAAADTARKEAEKRAIDLEVRASDDRLRIAQAEADVRRAELRAGRPGELVASIELRKADLDLALARAELDRLRREVDAARRAAEAELDGARNDQRQAEEQADALETGITRMSVRAPRDGTVVYRVNWNNEKKKVGDRVWYGERVLEIPDTSRMMTVGEVEEVALGEVAPGQRVTLRLDAHPEVEYGGRVVAISSMVRQRSRRNRVKVADLEIELDRTDPERMRPGMRLRGTVEVDRHEDVLTVPLSAVASGPDGTWVLRRGWLGAERVRVELGARGGGRVEVRGGLRPGDAIADSPTIDREGS